MKSGVHLKSLLGRSQINRFPQCIEKAARPLFVIMNLGLRSMNNWNFIYLPACLRQVAESCDAQLNGPTLQSFHWEQL
jgi:hypothetical protein